MTVANGYVDTNDIVANQSAFNTCRVFNYDGKAARLVQPSAYLLNIWDQCKKRVGINSAVKKGMARLFEQKQHRVLADAEARANQMVEAFNDRMNLVHADGSKWTTQEQAELKKVVAEGYQLKHDSTIKSTSRAVFLELQRLVSQHQENNPGTFKPQAVLDEEKRVEAMGGPARSEEDVRKILGQRILLRHLVQVSPSRSLRFESQVSFSLY